MTLGLAVVTFAGTAAARIFASRDSYVGHDCKAHLFYAERIALMRSGPFSPLPIPIVNSLPLREPLMWHWLVSFLPAKTVKNSQHYLNPLLDAIFSVFIYLALLGLGVSSSHSLFAVCLYVATPIWFTRLSIGPRTNNFTPRLSSEIATNMFLFTAFIPLINDSGVAEVRIASSILLALYVLLSSKFGNQALFFLSPLICLITGKYEAVFILACAVCLAILISRGAYIYQLRQHLQHLSWYFKNNLSGKMYISHRNSLKGLFVRYEDETDFDILYRLVKRLIIENSFSGLLLKFPLFLYVLAGSILVYQGGWDPSVYAPIISAVILYLLINIPHMLFLGEAERYLNHVAIFIVLAAVDLYLAGFAIPWLWAIVGYGLAWLLIEGMLAGGLDRRSNDEAEDQRKVIAYLKTVPSTVVLGFPFTVCGGHYTVMSETSHQTIYIGGNINIGPSWSAKYSAGYPYVDLGLLEDMEHEMGVKVLICSRAALRKNALNDWQPPDSWYEVTMGCQGLKIYVADSLLGRSSPHAYPT